MQLIKITTTPIEYKLQLENASLKSQKSEPAKITSPNIAKGDLSINSENIKVQLDTSAARQSLGAVTLGQFAKQQGEKGMNAAKDATAEYARIGNALAQIQNGNTIPTVFAQMMNKQPQTAMVFLPSQGPDISWKKNYIDMKYTPANSESEYQQAKFSMEYVPAKYRMNIVQYPKVNIEYVGGPVYVPASANPNK